MNFKELLESNSGRTADSFVRCDRVNQLSSGALADYGFDPMIYYLNSISVPSAEQLESLWSKYQSIMKDMGKEAFADHLHNNNSNLSHMLGDGFEWVQGTNSLFT